jgi:four helix bundle protein
MATINKFEDLEIWQLARKLYNDISSVCEYLRSKKEFRFAEQMKSSSGSIMDNIAEGFERSSRLEFLNSLSISKGEIGELKSQLYRCFDDKYISELQFSSLYNESDILSKKIASFIIYLNSTAHKGLKFKDRLKDEATRNKKQ